MRVQQEMVKKEPDMRVLESLISEDQSLSSQVLQIANSAFYKGLVEILTVGRPLSALVCRRSVVSLCWLLPKISFAATIRSSTFYA